MVNKWCHLVQYFCLNKPKILNNISYNWDSPTGYADETCNILYALDNGFCYRQNAVICKDFLDLRNCLWSQHVVWHRMVFYKAPQDGTVYKHTACKSLIVF